MERLSSSGYLMPSVDVAEWLLDVEINEVDESGLTGAGAGAIFTNKTYSKKYQTKVLE